MRRDNSEMLRCCVAAARAAGKYAVDHRPRRREIHKQFSHDVKLELDLECQAQAFSVIRDQFPEDSLLGEEGAEKRDGAYEWIIDPIDGTVNFFHGLNWWCSSVAVRKSGKVLAGAVYGPEQNMLFEADSNSQTKLNGAPVTSSAVEDLADALCVTGSEKEMFADRPPLSTAQTIAPHVQKIRILGAAALDICQVACGSVDLFCQQGLYIWDVAAAGLIVEKSGGIYRQVETSEKGRYACYAGANQKLADAFSNQFPDL